MKILMILFLFILPLAGFSFQLNEDECVYLVLDKPYHAAGEKLAYTAYGINRFSHTLTNEKELVYVDLYHAHGKKLLSQVLQLNEGRAQGILTLSDTLSAGIYHLVAYANTTSGMYRKEIFISSSKALVKPIHPTQSLIIRAEGGAFINHVEQVFAVKISDQSGVGLAGSGVIRNQEGDLVTKFSTEPTGIGSFKMKPQQGVSYRGELVLDGQLVTTPTFRAEADGYSLAIDQTNPDSLRLLIRSSPSMYGKKFLVQIENRGVLAGEVGGVASPAGFRVVAPSGSFLPGLLKVQVVSENKVWSSRLVFLNEKTEAVTARISINDRYDTRTQAKISIGLTNLTGQAVKGKFTVKIYEQAYQPTSTAHDNFFLKSELQSLAGVSLPNELGGDLDHFLMLQASDTPIGKGTKDKSGFINVMKGQVLEKQTGKPLADTTLVLSILANQKDHPYLIFKKTDNTGNFNIIFPSLTNNCILILKVKDVDETKDLVEFKIQDNSQDSLPTQLSKNRFELGAVVPYYRTFLENEAISKSFEQPIKSMGLVKDNFDDYAFHNFDESYVMSEYVALPTLRDVIIDIMNGVIIRKSRDQFRIYLLQKDQYTGRFDKLFPKQPLLLVDGVPVFNTNVVAAIPPNEIERIEVAHDRYFFDRHYTFGIFSVITKGHSMRMLENVNQYRFTSTTLQADIAWSFPDATWPKEKPDFRSLLFYDPLAHAENIPYTAQFNTGDGVGAYRIVVEGVTETGQLFSASRDFKIEKR
jgi:5-hydroxyisourate hydrolase-like protein (transthyretin family)